MVLYTAYSIVKLIETLLILFALIFQPRNYKITDFARNYRPHPKHIQKRHEEVTLKWMLLTNQPLSAVTNEAYKEKMAEFDPSFTIRDEQKIKTMMVKS